jgi:hypothetical protein
MEYQDAKRPAMSVFALAAILVLCVACTIKSSESLQMIVGCIVLGSGSWALWQVGSWAWWRYGSRHGVDAFR